MNDFREGRKKNLDLVLCTPGSRSSERAPVEFASLVERYSICLDDAAREALETLPRFLQTPVGSVHAALEAKACMTEHLKARPRLYDELNSSHLTIHGASAVAIAVGFIMINVSETFQSQSRGTVTRHRQPDVAVRVMEKVKELPRRSSTAESGFDAIGITLLDCRNDGSSQVVVLEHPPAPREGDIFEYGQMIRRIAHLYESRFPQL